MDSSYGPFVCVYYKFRKNSKIFEDSHRPPTFLNNATFLWHFLLYFVETSFPTFHRILRISFALLSSTGFISVLRESVVRIYVYRESDRVNRASQIEQIKVSSVPVEGS